jgi:hypothetical protein
MTDEAFCHKAMQYVEAGFFTSASLGWVFSVMRAYYTDYQTRCTELPLREAARKKPGHAPEIDAIVSLGHVAEHEFIKAQLGEFVKRNIFARAHEESQKEYNAGRHIKAYDMTCEAMDRLRQVDFDSPDRSWFFEELEERQARRVKHAMHPTEGVYPTGFDPIDDSMDGGPKRGETHLVLGDAKVGKTTYLINQGFMNTRVSRVPVLHINLEGNTTLVEDRYDACFTRELYTNVKHGDINSLAYKEMVEEYRQLRRLLVVRTLNDWDVNILHIEAELKELETDGFIPQVIILDYVDLLRSRNKVSTETAHQIDSMKDTKRLANRGYLIHSACQSQRPKDGDEEKERIVRAKDIADAYGKIRITDGWGSLNATTTEQTAGTCRYFHENYRDGRVGKLYQFTNEQDRMRLGVKVQQIAMKTSSTGTGKPPRKGRKGSVASGPTS